MSNNAAVCPDGSEIGRAQAVQALAAGEPLRADFNPVLIKPEADARSQVIVLGRPYKTLEAAVYYQHREMLWETARGSLDRLRDGFDLVIIEGAGSPVELNLKAGDIVNMAIARYAQSPVLLVGDIDRGGIFAQLLGTLWLLEPEERKLVGGLLVNKFRGDSALFTEGIKILEERGGVPVLGVIPYLKDLRIPEEDAVALEAADKRTASAEGLIDIAVIHLPRISNFDDFDPFLADNGVQLRYAQNPAELGKPKAIIIPGTKSTTADMAWLRSSGLADHIIRHARDGGAVVGICGGYQMLGRYVHDPQMVESNSAVTAGLGLLDSETEFMVEKTTHQASAVVRGGPGWLRALAGMRLNGYEIHMGKTVGHTPWLQIERRSEQAVEEPDGDCSRDGKIWGCYLHGLFSNRRFRHGWLSSLGWEAPFKDIDSVLPTSDPFDALADAVEEAVDMQQLEALIWEN